MGKAGHHRWHEIQLGRALILVALSRGFRHKSHALKRPGPDLDRTVELSAFTKDGTIVIFESQTEGVLTFKIKFGETPRASMMASASGPFVLVQTGKLRGPWLLLPGELPPAEGRGNGLDSLAVATKLFEVFERISQSTFTDSVDVINLDSRGAATVTATIPISRISEIEALNRQSVEFSPTGVNRRIVHLDERGYLVEVSKGDGPHQYTIISVNPSKMRGGHFHLRLIEDFTVIHGQTRFEFGPSWDPDSTFDLTLDHAEAIRFPVGWWHSVHSCGESSCLVGISSSVPYDPTASDTFAYYPVAVSESS